MTGPTAALGVWDGLSAKAAESAGAQMLCASGFAISASYGLPDAELYTLTENLAAIERIRESSSLPIIADVDTGYGNALNAARMARKFVDRGVDYAFMEDQVSPKECPVSSTAAVEVVDSNVFVGKIRAVKDAVGDDLKLVARIDAHGEEAIRRAAEYAEAGADLIMPVSKTFTTIDEWKDCGKAAQRPLVATLTPSTWIEREFTSDLMKDLNVQIAIYPTQALVAATQAIIDTFRTIAGDMNARADWGLSHSDFSTFIGFDDVHRDQVKYLPSKA